jgi:hypothetical protein
MEDGIVANSASPIISKASRVIPGQVVPQPTSPEEWLAIGRTLLAQARQEYGIPDSAQTVAVGWSGIDGLASQRFVGASRSIREASYLPAPIDHINAPRSNAQFLDHAEQDIANAFIDALQGLPHRPPLEGEWLRIFVSHAKGPCAACAQGLNERQVDPGVLGQLSRRFPGLTVVLAWESGEHRLHHMMIQDGVRL